jgi:hypothetical protein
MDLGLDVKKEARQGAKQTTKPTLSLEHLWLCLSSLESPTSHPPHKPYQWMALFLAKVQQHVGSVLPQQITELFFF